MQKKYEDEDCIVDDAEEAVMSMNIGAGVLRMVVMGNFGYSVAK